VAQFLPEQIPEGVESFEALAVWAVARLARLAGRRTLGAGANGAQVSAVSIARIEAADGRLYARLEAFIPLLLERLNDPEEKTWMSAGAVVGAVDPIAPPPPPPPPLPGDPLYGLVRLLINVSEAAGSAALTDRSTWAVPVSLVGAANVNDTLQIPGLRTVQVGHESNAKIVVQPSESLIAPEDFCFEMSFYITSESIPDAGTLLDLGFSTGQIAANVSYGYLYCMGQFVFSGYSWPKLQATRFSIIRSAGLVRAYMNGAQVGNTLDIPWPLDAAATGIHIGTARAGGQYRVPAQVWGVRWTIGNSRYGLSPVRDPLPFYERLGDPPAP